MNNLKFGWGHYWSSTPKGIRKIADALLAGAMTVSTIGFVNDYKTISIVVLIVAGIAKFLSNFFTEDTLQP
jgi:hypothetical protein